jgi:RNA polymerase sigma-70 factor (ECF subfamily)
VWALARRFRLVGADAEDAVQEIFVDLWRHAARFDAARASESTFVTMVARRRLIDRARRDARAPEEVEVSGEEVDPAPTASDRTEQADDVRAALSVIDTLAPDRKRVLLLSLWKGLTHQEIAHLTGLPLGTVKTHIRRGLKEVREHLRHRMEA